MLLSCTVFGFLLFFRFAWTEEALITALKSFSKPTAFPCRCPEAGSPVLCLKIKIGSILGNPWALLLFAALIASGLTYLSYQYLAAREERLKESMAQQRQAGVKVVVPVRDIEAGTSLASGVFAMREIPRPGL